jgi:hypothetical protein
MQGSRALARGAVGLVLAGLVAGCWGWGDGQDTWTAPHDGRNVRVAVRSDPVLVGAGEVLEGDLVVVGGEASVDGEVRGNLVVVAGKLHLGGQGVVGHDLVAVGNEVTDVAPTARIGAVNFPGIRWIVENTLLVWDNPLLTLLVALVGTAILLWLAWRVLIRKYEPERFHGTFEHHAVRAGLFGLILHIAFGALTLAAFLGRYTIGLVLPLSAAGFLLGFIGWLMGAVHVGRLLARKRGWTCGTFTYGMAGFAVVGLLSLIPVLGQLGAFVLSLIGIGALVMPVRMDELPRSPSAPPLPPAPPVEPPPVAEVPEMPAESVSR